MRVYLDNAATSWPKPECVYEAVDRYQREIGAAAGRGTYREAAEAQRIVDAARRGCAALLGVADASRIVFTANGTDALNLAIHGILRRKDHVVATVCEHNSVLRPLAHRKGLLDVETTFVSCDASGFVDPEEVGRAIRTDTRLVIASHASNVTGALQPIAQIGQVAHQRDALLLVDAAQSLGHVPLEAEQLQADLVAASGHKGLLGPLGVGVLYVRPGLEKEVRPVRQGGAGFDSQRETQPGEMPARYEAGNLDAPALAGLAAATRFLAEHGVPSIADSERRLCRRLIEGLQSEAGAKVFGPDAEGRRVGVVSFSIEGYDPQELALALDASATVQVRAGLHCAPRMHRALGTDRIGGLVRMSLGWATTADEVDLAIQATAALAAAPL